jgi:hypothetical protein
VYRGLGGTRGIARAGGFYFFLWKGNENHQLGIFFLQRRIVSAVRRVEFVSDSDSSVRSLVLNVHATNEEKSDYSKTGLVRIILPSTIRKFC